MANVLVIALRYGVATQEAFSSHQLETYRQLAEWVLGIRVSRDALRADVILPIPASTDAQTTMEAVDSRLAQAESGKSSLVVVDLLPGGGDFLPGKVELAAAMALRRFLVRTPTTLLDVPVLLLLAQLPPETDAVHQALSGLIAGGRVAILDNGGNKRAAEGFLHRVPKSYRQLRQDYFGTSEQRLRLKMVRRVGHFRRSMGNNDYICAKYFYDLGRAEAEVVHLVRELIEASDWQPRMILFDVTVSRWLRDCAIAVGQELHIPVVSVEELEKEGSPREEPLLVLLPLVDTGRTAEQLVARAQAVGLSEINVLSVLSTGGDLAAMGRRSIATTNGGPEYLRYILKVDRGLARREACPLCASQVPFADVGRATKAALDPISFWTLAIEAGAARESDVPPVRRPVRAVPNLSRMLKDHGAFIAERILIALEERLAPGFPAIPAVLVFQKEAALEGVLRRVSAIEPAVGLVAVPKRIVNMGRPPGHLDSGRQGGLTDQSWSRQLLSTAAGQTLVICEEFCLTGSTRNALREVARFVDRAVTLHFPLFDFRSEVDGDSTVSLYAISLASRVLLQRRRGGAS